MAPQVGVKEILIAGGPVLVLLILLSIYSFALIWERWRFYQRSISDLKPLLEKVRGFLKDAKLTDALAFARHHKGLASSVIIASLVGPANREERKRGAERAAAQAYAELDSRIAALGTIASISPFIGLFGTVLGIMRAFRDLASVSGAGPGVVAIGISEALVCTAAGLLVAIPALVAYNHFNSRASRFLDEMHWLSDEILETLAEKASR